MIVNEVLYKDTHALELRTKTLRAAVVPQQGGKIVSFRGTNGGREYLLQNPSKTFLPMGMQDDFVACECAGFDDMFPTIDPVSLTCEDGTELSYPDHGEVCRVPFTAEIDECSLTLRYESEALGYSYEKRFTEDADGGLRIVYRIHNHSPRDLNVLWAGHFLLNVDKGGRFIIPFGEGEDADVMFDTAGLFNAGERITLRDELLYTNWETDFPVCRKLYFPRQAPEGYISYRYPTGEEITMEFDKNQLPYIGLWFNLGYLNGAYCAGLEPASVGYDTVKNAERYGQSDVLKKGCCKEFFLKLSIK